MPHKKNEGEVIVPVIIRNYGILSQAYCIVNVAEPCPTDIAPVVTINIVNLCYVAMVRNIVVAVRVR
jgi:hypothetical protein